MVYVEYEQYKQKYQAAQRKYDKILSKKEKLFAMTQPKSTDFGKDKITGGKPKNLFAEYLVKLEENHIEEKLEVALSILTERKRLLDMKREELNQSNDWYDIIYRHRYIDNLSVEEIKLKIPYCRASIYKILNKIEKNIKV